MWTPSSVIQDLWQPDAPYGTDSQKHARSGKEPDKALDEGQHTHLTHETEAVESAESPLYLRLVAG